MDSAALAVISDKAAQRPRVHIVSFRDLARIEHQSDQLKVMVLGPHEIDDGPERDWGGQWHWKAECAG